MWAFGRRSLNLVSGSAGLGQRFRQLSETLRILGARAFVPVESLAFARASASCGVEALLFLGGPCPAGKPTSCKPMSSNTPKTAFEPETIVHIRPMAARLVAKMRSEKIAGANYIWEPTILTGGYAYFLPSESGTTPNLLCVFILQ